MQSSLNIIFSLGFVIAVSSGLRGQDAEFGPCSLTVEWENVRMVDEIPEGMECMLLISNRSDHSAKNKVLFPNELADYRKVNYLWAACDSGQWILSRATGFKEGLKRVDRGQDILVFVHGHGKSMPLVLSRAMQVRKKYGVALVVFDWPSYNSNFNKSLSRVRRCGENFYNLILQLSAYRNEEMKDEQHLSLFMHSLGNYFLSHMVINGNNQYLNKKVFDNIIVNSAAIRAKEHGKVLSQLKLQDRLYVVYNHNDRVLRGAHLLTSGRMLGNGVLSPLASNASYIDFTSLAGREHTYFAGYHDFEYTQPAFSHFYEPALLGREVDLGPAGFFRQEKGGKQIFFPVFNENPSD